VDPSFTCSPPTLLHSEVDIGLRGGDREGSDGSWSVCILTALDAGGGQAGIK
jgi:hypothetical protein